VQGTYVLEDVLVLQVKKESVLQ